MNRITKAFADKPNEALLNLFYTAGYPNFGDTLSIARAIEAAGADMIEIGIPYSDPIADGPTIQAASAQAIEQGMGIDRLLVQLEDLRPAVQIPVILMGYVAPILHYGIEAFCAKAKSVGVDGVILPDLPLEVYERDYKLLFEAHDLAVIFLIAPRTSAERIKAIDAVGAGFIYAVSSSSTTGNSQKGLNAMPEYQVDFSELRLPVMTGFNIKNAEDFLRASANTQGGIIGSAFVRHIADNCSAEHIQHFVEPIVKAKQS